jgi:hypothetical protein
MMINAIITVFTIRPKFAPFGQSGFILFAVVGVVFWLV